MKTTDRTTKRDFYEAIIKAMETGETNIEPAKIIEFCENEIALMDKKDDKDKDKDGKEQKQGKDAKPKEAGKSGEGNAPAVPAQEAVPAPTAPSPVPGGGGKKAN